MWHVPGVATVGFLHVAAAHVQAARRLLAEHAPGIVDVHVVDRTLLEATGDVSTRIAARVGELMGREVDAVVCTWPALVADVVRVASERGIAAAGVDELAAAAGGMRALSR
jgi:hypothetical protein